MRSEKSGVALATFVSWRLLGSDNQNEGRRLVCYFCLDYLKASRKSRSESSSSTCKQVTLEAAL